MLAKMLEPGLLALLTLGVAIGGVAAAVIIGIIQILQNRRKIRRKSQKTPSPIAPVFRNLKQESKDKSKLARSLIFPRLRFADCPIGYVRLDEVRRAFAGFYNSPDAFSWWLIVGGAGSGKSRTALEFCKFLQKKKRWWKWWKKEWRAGFVDIEGTPPEVWEKWCSERDTLLVIDYVAREFSDKPSRVTEIFTQLTLRAQENGLGDKRLRILLLEREYQERNEIGQPLKWYWQLDKICQYQDEPFDLSAVTNDELYQIATEAAERIWQSPNKLPEKAIFLDELAKFDKKKRPLFAILLAGYRAKVNPKAKITPNEVLDDVIQHELARSLFPKGKKTDLTLLNDLILSTCTGGKLGVRELSPDKDWLRNSGLGKEDDEQNFLFYPIEPDLLGERFVLNCDNPKNQFRIDKKQLQELLQAGWRQAPEETADFFNRCRQDFGKSDSEKIADLFLSAMPAIKEKHESQRAWLFTGLNLTCSLELADIDKVYQAMAGVGDTLEIMRCRAAAAYNLTAAYVRAEKISEECSKVRELYEAMAGFGDTQEIMLYRAQVATNLIGGYGDTRNLTEARQVFEDMAGFGDTSEIMFCRAMAASNLINSYDRIEELPEARKLYESMADFDHTPRIMLYRASAAFNLITNYSKAEKLLEARQVFETMAVLEAIAGFGGTDTSQIMFYRAQAAYNLILGYCKTGELSEARKVFNIMAGFGEASEIMLERAQAASNLALEYAKIKNLVAVREVYDAMAGFGDTREIMLERAKVVADLISCYDGKMGDIPEARKVFYAMASLGEGPEIAEIRAGAALNLIQVYAKTQKLAKKELAEARKLYEAMAGFGDTQEIMLERAKAAVNLCTCYRKVGKLTEAHKLFDIIPNFSDMPEIMLACAKTASYLITDYYEAGKLPEAQQVFEVMAGFGDTQEIMLERAKAAVNLIYSYTAKKLAKEKLMQARQVFETMADFGDTSEIMLYRAQAAANLMVGYRKVKKLAEEELREARKVFEAMASFGDEPETVEFRAKAAVNLITCYSKAGKLWEARQVFKAMVGFDDRPEIMLYCAQAAVNLIKIHLIQAEDLATARRLFEAMASFGDEPEIAKLRAEATSYLDNWRFCQDMI